MEGLFFFRKPFLKYEVTTCDFPDGPGKSELPMQGPRVQSQVMELRSCVLHRAAGKKQNMIQMVRKDNGLPDGSAVKNPPAVQAMWL